jgi:hypothetical protein
LAVPATKTLSLSLLFSAAMAGMVGVVGRVVVLEADQEACASISPFPNPESQTTAALKTSR